MKRFSPAKLNLFLHITGRRADGYHNLQSVFCAVDFGDVLTIELADHQSELVTLTGADRLTANLADNLIVRAVDTLAKLYPTHARPLAIHLDKQIPTGAGLGGGSSNCATTLLAVNQLWGLDLSYETLMTIGAGLGADVPFFIFADKYKTAGIVEGIGEQIAPLLLPACEFLLLLPQAHISTAQLFANPDLQRNCPSHSHQSLQGLNFWQLPKGFGNVFEPLVCQLSPEVKTALDYLKTLELQTKTHARMTGTGAVVFLPLIGIDKTTQADWVNNAPCPAMVVKTLYPTEF